ncbi:response regulator transcription factor [Rubripirellula amarantea]|uniref:Transcriptional regulatory protein WalR n=1 Tax=Rubripirellula amarantea TaxID=2527999 RepID=A0A5C5WWK4_9BACT|nr:response regulator transcription factor [Rubripirellula amarantea]MDA8744004.1 response regulator transcription factor [Rubripirellula amarantea]TWT54325.1 Transcriptional regulatory protein WalR [Rubripirellula amarantea]
MQKIMLVEDDAELASMVADFLRSESYDVTIEYNGAKAVQRILTESFDAIILDIGLPGMDGIQVCRTVRSDFEGPILVLTARGEEVDEVIALEVGADDYMAKPVRPKALLARIKLHLRRGEPHETSDGAVISIDGIEIDPASRVVKVDGVDVHLTTAEFDLMFYLAQGAGKVIGRSEIYQALLGMPYDGLDRSIDLRVSRLRKKIGDDPHQPDRIKSVRGVGYMLARQA